MKKDLVQGRKKLIKFGPKIAAEMVELSGMGWSDNGIAKLLGVHRHTVANWRKKMPHLDRLMTEAKEEGAKDCIEVGLRKLAAGAQDITTQDKYVVCKRVMRMDPETGEEKEELVPVERTRTIKEKAPDAKAIEVLSRKYEKAFDPKAKENEMIDAVLEGFNMRDLQEARKHNPIDQGKFIDAEFSRMNADEEVADGNES